MSPEHLHAVSVLCLCSLSKNVLLFFSEWILRPWAHKPGDLSYSLYISSGGALRFDLFIFGCTNAVFVWLWLVASADLLGENSTADWLVAGG